MRAKTGCAVAALLAFSVAGEASAQERVGPPPSTLSQTETVAAAAGVPGVKRALPALGSTSRFGEAAAPSPAPAWMQDAQGERRGDTLLNGILIGAASGFVYGMYVAPRQFCDLPDSECEAIVKVAIGLPSIGGGAAIGGLVDYLIGHKPRASVRQHDVRLTPLAGRGIRGVQASVVF